MKQLIAVAFVFVAFLLVPSAASAQPTPPAEWTCAPAFFGGDDGCDCGCGAVDPDCEDTTIAGCRFNGCAEEAQVPTAANPVVCTANTCGDGYALTFVETCDDGAGTACSADCTTVAEGFVCAGNAQGCHAENVCGDGFADIDELCDDGDTDAGDGCSATCTVEAGFDCGFTGTECVAVVCGDSLLGGDETCDDGNDGAGDGCDAACLAEEGFSCRELGAPCIVIPAGWTCSATFFGGGDIDGCDCGCGVEDPDCTAGPSCVEENCDDAGEVCAFCHGAEGAIVECGAPAEGEGEGEGEEGEGEGGEGEGEDDDGLTDDPNVDAAPGCASIPTDTSAAFALVGLVLAISRRRRRA